MFRLNWHENAIAMGRGTVNVWGGGEGGRPPLDNWGMPPALEKLGTQEDSAGTF